MKVFAWLFSMVFHPLFVLIIGLMLLLLANPYSFGVQNWLEADRLLLVCFIYTVFFPGLSILIMRGVGLVQSLHMESKEERWGPIIVCLVLYFWFFANIRPNPSIPTSFVAFTLGSCISLGLGFFTSLFKKTSLHAVGMGGLLGLAGMLAITSPQDHLMFGAWGFHPYYLLVGLVILSGVVGSARLVLGAHNLQDLIGGLLIGVSGQLIAVRILY